MQATENQVKVGDVVIYVPKHNARPIKTNVAKVTPKGWLRIDVPGSDVPSMLFRPCRYGSGYEIEDKLNDAKVYVYTDETWTKLNAEADELEAQRAAIEAARAQRDAEQAARTNAELAEVKDALDKAGGLAACVRHSETLPDGSRLFWLSLPVGPSEFMKHKGGFEVAIVRLKDIQEQDFRTGNLVTKIEMAFTNAHAASSSFGSYSIVTNYDSDDAALLDAARRLYHNW